MAIRNSTADEIPLLDAETLTREPASLWRTAMRRFFKRKSALVGMAILGVLVLIAITADMIAPYDPIQVLIGIEDVRKRQAPCIHHLTTGVEFFDNWGCPPEEPIHYMGIDGNVRDQFSRVLHGSRLSLVVGFTTVTFAIMVGTFLGAVSGYFGGWVDNVIMRIMDVLLAFPSLLLAIAIVTVLGRGLTNALIAIGIVTIPAYARVMRASVLSIKELDYIAASKAVGSSGGRILLVRILPNALTPLIVQGTLGIASAIIDAAALSFLGLGAQPPTPEWGSMVGAELNQVFTAPHLVFYPGLAITLTVLAFNLIGDGLRDALDPRLANR